MSIPDKLRHVPEWAARIADHRAVCRRRSAGCIIIDTQGGCIGQGWSGTRFLDCLPAQCACVDAEVMAVMFLDRAQGARPESVVSTHFPSPVGASMLAELGIKSLYCMNDEGHTHEAFAIFEKAGIAYQKIDFSLGT